MKTRVITGVVATAIFIPFLLLASSLAVAIVFSVLGIVASFEMNRCTGILKHFGISIPLMIYAGSIPMLCFFDKMQLIMTITLFLMLYVFIFSIFIVPKETIANISTSFLMNEYIAAGFSGMVLLQMNSIISNPFCSVDTNILFFLLPLIVAWMTDTFAYFSGRIFGKHKLCPEVSPKKTIEGAIGGIVFGVLFAVLFGIWMNHVFNDIIHVNLLLLLAVSPFLSVVSQTGDLIMSVVKRQYGIKDYGKIFPGHGGVLDRFDSVLATSLLLYLLNRFLPLFEIC